jgi:hypothetical protein
LSLRLDQIRPQAERYSHSAAKIIHFVVPNPLFDEIFPPLVNLTHPVAIF